MQTTSLGSDDIKYSFIKVNIFISHSLSVINPYQFPLLTVATPAGISGPGLYAFEL